jgi:predicted transcriptional regulator
MDIQALKIDLAQKILKSNKPLLLQKIDQLLKSEDTGDWWDELPKEIQDSIALGLKDAEQGEVWTHEQIVREAKARY